MAAPHDAQGDREANPFRPDRRPFLFGLAANLLLAFVFIVLPYSRARVRASEARHAFAQFAACFLDGKVLDDPGLAFPAGEREHYAKLVMHGDAKWPARCDAALHAIAPSQATFLFPSVKQADADTRAAIELFRTEAKVLAPAQRARLDHVPGRPLLALSRVRSALAMLLEAAGDADSIDREAITLAPVDQTVVGTRVPLSAASGAALHMQSQNGVFSAHALDQRGLSWVRVQDGKVDRHRPKRERLLRALTFAPEPLLIWALTEARCAGLENGCVHRAMGAALLGDVGAALPSPLWITAHPPGRADRHVRLQGDRLWVLALDDAAAKRELRTFTLKAGKAPDTEAKTAEAANPDSAATAGARPDSAATAAKPTGAQELWSLGDQSIHDSLLLHTTPPQLLTATVQDAASTIELRTFEPTITRSVLTNVQGTAPFLLQCHTGSTMWLAAFTEAAASLIRVPSVAVQDADRTPDAAPRVGPLSAGAAWPFHVDDPARDRVTLLCDNERAVVLTLDESKQTLTAQTCDNQLECSPARIVADKTRAFSALLRGPDLIIASAANAENAQVHVQRFDGVLAPLGPRQTPAPCWSPTEGFCGQPALTQDAQRVLLAARDQSDLLVIESRDGSAWWPMSGLKVDDSLAPDGSIMDIHRDRKRYTH